MTRSTEEGRYVFITDCIGADGDDINEMKRAGKIISIETFRKAIGQKRWKDIQAQLGYDRHMPIRKDWHVGYFRSTYRGVPAVYLVWSGIEHVFTLDGKGHARGFARGPQGGSPTARMSARARARRRAGLSAGRNERQRELERAIDYHAKRGEQGQVRALTRALSAEQQGIDTTDWALPMGAYYRAVLAERARMGKSSRTLPTGRAILPPSIAASPASAAASPASAAAPMESAPVTVVEPSNERNARRAAYLAEHLKDLPESKYYPQLYDRYLKAQREVDPGASSLGIMEFTRRIRDLEAMYEQKYARKWRFDIEPGRGRIELIGVPL